MYTHRFLVGAASLSTLLIVGFAAVLLELPVAVHSQPFNDGSTDGSVASGTPFTCIVEGKISGPSEQDGFVRAEDENGTIIAENSTTLSFNKALQTVSGTIAPETLSELQGHAPFSLLGVYSGLPSDPEETFLTYCNVPSFFSCILTGSVSGPPKQIAAFKLKNPCTGEEPPYCTSGKVVYDKGTGVMYGELPEEALKNAGLGTSCDTIDVTVWNHQPGSSGGCDLFDATPVASCEFPGAYTSQLTSGDGGFCHWDIKEEPEPEVKLHKGPPMQLHCQVIPPEQDGEIIPRGPEGSNNYNYDLIQYNKGAILVAWGPYMYAKSKIEKNFVKTLTTPYLARELLRNTSLKEDGYDFHGPPEEWKKIHLENGNWLHGEFIFHASKGSGCTPRLQERIVSSNTNKKVQSKFTTFALRDPPTGAVAVSVGARAHPNGCFSPDNYHVEKILTFQPESTTVGDIAGGLAGIVKTFMDLVENANKYLKLGIPNLPAKAKDYAEGILKNVDFSIVKEANADLEDLNKGADAVVKSCKPENVTVQIDAGGAISTALNNGEIDYASKEKFAKVAGELSIDHTIDLRFLCEDCKAGVDEKICTFNLSMKDLAFAVFPQIDRCVVIKKDNVETFVAKVGSFGGIQQPPSSSEPRIEGAPEILEFTLPMHQAPIGIVLDPGLLESVKLEKFFKCE